MTIKKELEIWTVYRKPLDYPTMYVARKFILNKPTDEILVAPTLKLLRNKLPQGLYRIPRSAHDDPVIEECWV